MAYTTLRLDWIDSIAHLVFTRGDKANAMNLIFWDEFPQAIAEVNAHKSARALVIRGEGRHFTAGIDIEALARLGKVVSGDGCPARAREEVLHFVEHAQAAFNAVERLRIPVIAAVQGACVGAGVDLLGACDIRLCAADARFCIKEADLAVVPDVGTLQRLRHVISLGALAELTYTAETFDATRARDIGLVSRVYPDVDALIAGANAMATLIASKSPITTRGIKRNLQFSRDHTVADGLAYAAAWNAGMLISEDSREAVMAQAQKRAPKFAD